MGLWSEAQLTGVANIFKLHKVVLESEIGDKFRLVR